MCKSTIEYKLSVSLAIAARRRCLSRISSHSKLEMHLTSMRRLKVKLVVILLSRVDVKDCEYKECGRLITEGPFPSMIQSCMIPRSQIIKLIYAMKLHTVHAKQNILPKHSSLVIQACCKTISFSLAIGKASKSIFNTQSYSQERTKKNPSSRQLTHLINSCKSDYPDLNNNTATWPR